MGARCRGVVYAALAAWMLPQGVVALFEDEVGQYEWFLQQIGRPTALAYSAEAPDRIFVASASGVISSVLLKDGTMQWRRMAATGDEMKLLRAAGRGLVSVTSSNLVQAWKGSTGDLTWQRDYADTVHELLLGGSGTKQSIIIVRNGEVEARTVNGGKHEWSAPAGAGQGFWAAVQSSEADVMCALSVGKDGADAHSIHIDMTTGAVKKQVSLTMPKGARDDTFMVADAHAVRLVGQTLSAVPLCGGTGSEFDLTKLKDKMKGVGATELRLLPWQRTAGVFAVTNGAATTIFGLGPNGLKSLRTFEGIAVVGPIFSVHEDETGQPVAVATLKEQSTQLQLMDPASGNVQPPILAAGYTAGDRGSVELLLVHETKSGEHRTVISCADHSFAGIQGERLLWVREEALADISQAVFYSRSAAATAAERLGRPQDEVKGLSSLSEQLSGLPTLLQDPAALYKAFVGWATPKARRSTRDMKLMPNARVPTSSEELRDFGADKLVIASTRSGKIFALEATTSEIVWQKYLGSGGKECNGAGAATGKIGTKSDPACSPSIFLLPSVAAPLTELIAIAPAAGGAQVVWIEPLSGSVVHQETSPSGSARIASVVPLQPKKGVELASQTVQPFMFIDSNHAVHVLPSGNKDVLQLAAERTDKLFHYEVDTASQAIKGYVVGSAAQGSKQELSPLWNLELGSVGEKVLAAAAPEHREWEHVPVHIKGDATILYKYINANMLAVATEAVSPKDNSSALSLYVMDAVTGHVLHQSHIANGAPPVHIAACDNWVVMHYNNPKKTRFEITVVELFQSKADDGPWDIIFGGKVSNQTKSAHHLEPPVPLQQTYIFPSGVASMATTATGQGITPRSLIMALTTEHIFRLSKDMLNPRRPYAPGVSKDKAGVPAQFAPTKEEILMPYMPVMQLKPADVLTYYQPIGQVEGIISSPTALESTSLVFCYGLDLFFTPVQSAKAYDVLSPGFNYVLLYTSVLVVLVLWVVTSFWASRKALQDRWR